MNDLNNLQNLCVIKHRASRSPSSSPVPFQQPHIYSQQYIVKHASTISHTLKKRAPVSSQLT